MVPGKGLVEQRSSTIGRSLISIPDCKEPQKTEATSAEMGWLGWDTWWVARDSNPGPPD